MWDSRTYIFKWLNLETKIFPMLKIFIDLRSTQWFWWLVASIISKILHKIRWNYALGTQYHKLQKYTCTIFNGG